MYKKELGLFLWGYMIYENEIRLTMKYRSHRCKINRPRPRHGHKYTEYKMSQRNDACMC